MLKFRLLIIVSSFLPLILIGYYTYYLTSQSLTKNVLATDRQNVESIVDEIQNILGVVQNNLKFLANFYSQLSTINALESFIADNQIFQQLQLIDPTGQELLRIDYDDNLRTTIAPLDESGNRQNSDCLSNIISLKTGKIHINNWQNFEKQVICYSNNIAQGILVLSLNANN